MDALNVNDSVSKFDLTLDSLHVLRALLNECIISSKRAKTITNTTEHINDWISNLEQVYKELYPKLKKKEINNLIRYQNLISKHQNVSELVKKDETKLTRIYKNKYLFLYKICNMYELRLRFYLNKKNMLIANKDDSRWSMV